MNMKCTLTIKMKNEWCTGKDFKIIKSKKGIKHIWKNMFGTLAEDSNRLPFSLGGIYNRHEAKSIKRIYIECLTCKQRFNSSIENCGDGDIFHRLPRHKVK